MNLLSLFNRKTLSIIGLGILALSIIIYIFCLKSEISSLKDTIHSLEIDNQALTFSNANLTNAVDAQNQAIENLNIELDLKNAELDDTIKSLEEEYNEQLKLLEDSYENVEITDANNAINWLKSRKY